MSEAKGATKANAKIKDEKKRDVREQNIMAAKCTLLLILALSDLVRTSLGPRGMDKMVPLNLTIDPREQWRGAHYQ